MKMNNGKMRIGALALAVQGALLAMSAMPVLAEDDEISALTMPTNYIEVGAANTSRSSAKFGEYNGQNKSGESFIGNIGVRGGDAYGDSNGTKRWSITGNNLGTTSRSLGATVSDQGKWNLGLDYDELRHNLTDTYQTPYRGVDQSGMGGNVFVLPSGFGLINTTAPGTRVLNAAQQAAMHTVDVGTTRKNLTFSAGVNLTPEWSVAFDYNRLNQSGAKLMAFGGAGQATGANAAPSMAGLAGITTEAVAILPNPTNYKTDTVNLALNWTGEKGYMNTAYFGSSFKDGYDRVTFQSFGVTSATGTNSVMQTMSTPPSNTFQQLNLNGAYMLAARTKLAGGISYGRNTQNDAFAYDSYMMVTPPVNNSLNGKVVNTHADLKLTDQTTNDLALSAGVKYDQRDNRTASNLYNFNSIGGNVGHYAHYPNTPLSNKKTQLELAGDYRVSKGQNLRVAFNREDVKRWCNQYATGGTTALVDAYVAGVNNYPAGTNCVVATGSKDDKVSATYKVKASDEVSLNAGIGYSDRKTTSDPKAIAAFISQNGNVPGGTFRGINGGDFLGFSPFFTASRKQQLVKAGANWQAGEKFSLGVTGKLTDDKYGSTYGVQKGNSWSFNLDAVYNYSDAGSLSAYASQQHMQRDMTSLYRAPTTAAGAASTSALNVPSGATWSNKLKGDDTTVGIGAKQGGLMGSKLELAGDLTYSLGKTGYGTQLNYAAATTGGLTCYSPQILSCGNVPDIKNRMVQFKMVGNYQLDKSSRVALGYIYRNLKTTDYFYNGYQYGYTPSSVMPTNQQSGSYSVSVVSASYIYTF